MEERSKRSRKTGCLVAGCVGTPLGGLLLLLVLLDVRCGVSSAYLVEALRVGEGSFTPDHMEESKRRGNAIVAALEVWREEHGRYPRALDALVPDHLDEIEPPLAGIRAWGYEPAGHGLAYELWCADFPLKYPICVYARENVWPCRETSDVAETILAALDAWYAAHGNYPAAMSELVPDHLAPDVVPAGTWGWIYVRKPDGFELIDGNDDHCRLYRGWFCDT